MTVSRFMLDNNSPVEILSIGHFPTTVIVHNHLTNLKYEADFVSLKEIHTTEPAPGDSK